MLLGLGHGTVDGRDHQNTSIHLGSSSDHVLDVVDVSGAVHVGIVPSVCLILNGGSVDGDTSGFFFRGLVNSTVFDVFGFLLVGQIFGDGRCEGSLAVIDVSDGADCVKEEIPLTWASERSNLAKDWVRRVVRGEKVLEKKFPSISITNKYIFSHHLKKVLRSASCPN